MGLRIGEFLSFFAIFTFIKIGNCSLSKKILPVVQVRPPGATIYPEHFLASGKECAALSWATKQA